MYSLFEPKEFSCFFDDWLVYFILAVVNSVAFIVPVFLASLRRKKKPKTLLVCLNAAMFCSVYIAIKFELGSKIALVIIVSLTGILYALYSFLGSLVLLSAIMAGLGLSLGFVGEFMTDWLSSFIEPRIIRFVFLALSIVSVYISYRIQNSPLVEMIWESFVFSFLFVFAVKYFISLDEQYWPNRTELLVQISHNNITFFNNNNNTTTNTTTTLAPIFLHLAYADYSVFCCDDNTSLGPCPTWFSFYDCLIAVYIAVGRLAIVVLLERHLEVLWQQRQQQKK